MPGIAPLFLINSGIDIPLLDVCLKVSSNNITPLIDVFIEFDENKVSLKLSLFFSVHSTFTLFNLFSIVPVLSSAASIPLPLATIIFAISSIFINFSFFLILVYQAALSLQEILRMHPRLLINM